MWRYICLLLPLLLCTTMLRVTTGADNGVATTSSQMTYYHYPAPAGKGLNVALQTIQHQHQQQQQQQQSQHKQQQLPQQQQSQTHNAAPPLQRHQQQYQQHHHYPQQQQQPLPLAASRSYQYQAPAAVTSSAHKPAAPASPALQQFASSTLESVAFTMALRSQGLSGGGGGGQSGGAHIIELRSLNIKLPVPLGVAPINVGPLPLQSGTPYSSLRGVTSYGTPYPQR